MIHIYLDDLRPCPKGFVAARSADECIVLLQECEVDILSLDFDLGLDAPSGNEVARWIVVSGRFPRRLYVHTSSPAGREQMVRTLLPVLPQGVSLHSGPMPDDVRQQAASSDGE